VPKQIVDEEVYRRAEHPSSVELNTSGVIPPILPSSILMFPLTIANFMPKALDEHLSVDSIRYLSLGPAWLYNSM
jgi:preprotein translocase subunit SecY